MDEVDGCMDWCRESLNYCFGGELEDLSYWDLITGKFYSFRMILEVEYICYGTMSNRAEQQLRGTRAARLMRAWRAPGLFQFWDSMLIFDAQQNLVNCAQHAR